MFESDFDCNEYPLAYLITVRTFGTWLHGDERLSVDRHGLNLYGRRRRAANDTLHAIMLHNMKQDAFLLNDKQRATVKSAIEGVYNHRKYQLSAVNVLTNHFHSCFSSMQARASR